MNDKNSTTDFNRLAELLLPGVDAELDQFEKKYPPRNLPESAVVTRFAPSPTGLPHIGNLFACYAGMQSAHQSGGVFMLRVEDTDTKRTVEGGVEKIITVLGEFGIHFDERPTLDGADIGLYGPYVQSARKNIYQSCVKYLIQKGFAYPCFCSREALDEMRKRQNDENVPAPGYFGKWATCRDLPYEEVERRVTAGEEFVIRLHSAGKEGGTVVLRDLIRGEITFPENIFDVVILKTDGLPTYHFAHATDDHFMRTTHVIRADEWLPSFPIHHELFRAMGFALPEYAHVPPLLKIDGNSKRKISKRKDSESALAYYGQEGYVTGALMEYIASIANSTFESWRLENPSLSYETFPFQLGGMSSSGAVFDLMKLDDVSREYIARLTADEFAELYADWARIHDQDMAAQLAENPDYFKAIFGIERGGEKPRKDIYKLSMVKEYYTYFLDDCFDQAEADINALTGGKTEDFKAALACYLPLYDPEDDKDAWFAKIKETAVGIGYAPETKLYRKNPENYKGQLSEVASFIRIALTKRTQTPDLYAIAKVLGKEKVICRLEAMIQS